VISSEDYLGLKHRPHSISSRALDKRRTEIGICKATDRIQESGRPVLIEHCTLRYPTYKMAREVAEALPLGPDYYRINLTTYSAATGWQGQATGSRDADGNWQEI
jgi:hypothetical protein